MGNARESVTSGKRQGRSRRSSRVRLAVQIAAASRWVPPGDLAGGIGGGRGLGQAMVFLTFGDRLEAAHQPGGFVTFFCSAHCRARAHDVDGAQLSKLYFASSDGCM